MIKRMTSCVWPTVYVAAACKEVCFRQNCSSAHFSALACMQEGAGSWQSPSPRLPYSPSARLFPPCWQGPGMGEPGVSTPPAVS